MRAALNVLVTGGAKVVPVQTSLSQTSLWLTRVIAVTYLLLGLIMFVVPAGPRIISRGRCHLSSR
jgi:hypothetical protein